MLAKSSNYNTIWNNANHYAEIMLIVGETSGTRTTYREQNIFSLSTNCSLFGDYFDIGNVVMNQVNIELYNVLPSAIPKLSRIEVWVRLTDGTNVTNWLPKGIFYTKKPTYQDKTLTVTGYDMMFMTEDDFPGTGHSFTAWVNPTLQSVAKHLTSGYTDSTVNTGYTGCGIALEDATQLSTTMTMGTPPVGYTVRELLSEIALCECGNWMLTYVNSGTEASPEMTPKLRLTKMSALRSSGTTSGVAGIAIAGQAIVGTN